jgi:negative regulator of sigma E activity
MSNSQISIDEQLSALTDGELERGPSRFLLRRVENDATLAQRFERYQLMRACLRREYKGNEADSFAAGVMARIDADAGAESAQPRAARSRFDSRSPWITRLLGGAIAASVAGVVLFASSQQAPAPAPQVATRVMSQPPAESGLRLNLEAQTVAQHTTTIIDPRIEEYLVRHSGAVATVGQRGALPYAYAVGLPTQPQSQPVDTDPNVRPASAVGAQGQ